jgi:molybdopterin molybdotransferase
MPEPPLEIDAARELVLARAPTLGSEPVAVRDALGRVLAEDVTSADAVPGFDNSAMDGYAVRAADTAGAGAGPVPLAVVGESRAGHPAERALGPGEAIAISTGAMVPEGADAVVRVEDTDGGAETVEVRAEVAAGRDIRRAGEDIPKGETVLRAGAEIGPAAAGVLTSIGRAEVACARRPRVTVLTTGDELQEPGEPLRPGGIRNSNAHSVAGLVERSGAELLGARIVPDDREATKAALAEALAGDVVVVCGGVSVGEHDHVRPALAALGVEQVFWRVALRPGAPTYFGVADAPATSSASPPGVPGHQKLVFGLPGNPVSAMVTFLLFARPAIRRMLGAGDERRRGRAALSAEQPALATRAQLVRCRLELTDRGWRAHPTGEQGSHVLTSMLDADALAILPPADAPYPGGTMVEFELLPS